MPDWRGKIEYAIGEDRAAIYRGRKLVTLLLWRHSKAGQPKPGEEFIGKITGIDKNMMAAFLDLGSGQSGFLRFTLDNKAPKITEGMHIKCRVQRPPEPDKSALVRFLSLADADIGRVKSVSFEDYLKAKYQGIKTERAKVGGIEQACESEIDLPSGGLVTIEHTKAGTMIDIDTGTATKFKTAMEAAKEIPRQIGLRGIGGLILADFPNLRAKKQRADVWQTFKDGFGNDVEIVKIAPFSRFGTVEMTRSQVGLSLAQIALGKDGQPTDETLALRGLNRLLDEAKRAGGAEFALTLPNRAVNWLEAGYIDWKKQLDDKIGQRYKIERGKILDVRKIT